MHGHGYIVAMRDSFALPPRSATNMNDESSRSHMVFTLDVKQTGAASSAKGKKMDRVSRMNLIDLAGSERAKATGAQGEALKEGANINKSVSIYFNR